MLSYVNGLGYDQSPLEPLSLTVTEALSTADAWTRPDQNDVLQDKLDALEQQNQDLSDQQIRARSSRRQRRRDDRVRHPHRRPGA